MIRFGHIAITFVHTNILEIYQIYPYFSKKHLYIYKKFTNSSRQCDIIMSAVTFTNVYLYGQF